MQEATDQILGNQSNPDYDTFLKGMIRAFQEVQDAKPNLLEDAFQEESTNEV